MNSRFIWSGSLSLLALALASPAQVVTNNLTLWLEAGVGVTTKEARKNNCHILGEMV
jgi:hypothetical protein